MRASHLLTAVALLLWHCTGVASRCNRTPEEVVAPKTPADNRFRLRISGSPEKYVPGEVYTVSLQGSRNQQVPQKFTGFMLVVESLSPSSAMSADVLGTQPVGSFQLYGDALTKFSDNCPNMLIQSSSIPKAEIQVLWTAPPPGSGCIIFRAVVVEHKDVWYQDDGPLSKSLCEDVQENLDEQPSVIDECCACDEAKYEVTFEGLWSRHTHPKDFPSNRWLTRFSDVIGASHTTSYRFWEYGGNASEGLRQVAERGATRMLESELKSQSQNIRTIIKARGISYPNITGKTFAVFRVDRKHHLMSLVSMIDPSPDWIVGVSGLELCLRNCSWVESKVLNLYPWDAGTDSGFTYISPDSPTEPRENMRRISSSIPKDIRSPFYDPSGAEMKPMARLYLTRQRLYEKSCSDSDEETVDDDACDVGDWSNWSDCSVTCGEGVRSRQRYYKNQMKADAAKCKKQVTSRSSCYGDRSCGNALLEEDATQDPMCALTNWSPWSECSVSCGRGTRSRWRQFKERQHRKRCQVASNLLPLQQTDICYGQQGTNCPPPALEAANESEECAMSDWSDWSPCSVSCGIGKKVRSRKLMPISLELYEELENSRCPDVERTEVITCQADPITCELQPDEARKVCQLTKGVGPCRPINGPIERWFFDVQTQSCQKFAYSGCRGNRNRFATFEECEQTCQEFREELLANRTARLQQYGVSLSGGLSYDVEIQDTSCEAPEMTTLLPSWPDVESQTSSHNSNVCEENINCKTGQVLTATMPPLDCKVSHWSAWSECSVSCGKGVKEKSRYIRVHPANGGKPCPKKLLRQKKCRGSLCEDCMYTEWTMWSACSATCGPNASQQRSRVIAASYGEACNDLVEKRQCHLLMCET